MEKEFVQSVGLAISLWKFVTPTMDPGSLQLTGQARYLFGTHPMEKKWVIFVQILLRSVIP